MELVEREEVYSSQHPGMRQIACVTNRLTGLNGRSGGQVLDCMLRMRIRVKV